jgi:hypothetical protein
MTWTDSSGSEFIAEDNSDLLKDAIPEAIEAALEAVGQQCQRVCSEACPVDTGLLRNSIAYALAGNMPTPTTAKQAATHKDGTPVKNPKTETYSGSVPSDGSYPMTVYVGTGVEYAPKIEDRTGFLKGSITANADAEKKVFSSAFAQVMKANGF